LYGNLRPEATRIIRSALAGPDPRFQINAIEVVATSGQITLVPAVQRLMKSPEVPVRFAAASAIGDLRYSLAQRDVAELLGDSDENVRIAAAYAMARLGSAESLDVLLKAVTSTDQVVRANAVMLLGRAGDKNAIKALWWALSRDDSDHGVTLQAAESIAMLGDERIFPKIWATVISAYADDRVMGVKALGALGTTKAKEVLITKLDDDVLEVRLAAAEQLGANGDTAGEPQVLDVFSTDLTGPDLERVRVLAALATGRICTPRLRRNLPELLSDQSQAVRIAAAKAVFLCSPKPPAPDKPPI
ncbi:MAG: HEAT repeat domain-containing protein, partial [Planctomycetota bacterium]